MKTGVEGTRRTGVLLVKDFLLAIEGLEVSDKNMSVKITKTS